VTSSALVLAVDLNSPGKYLHWSIFTVSVANLVLIAVMVVIFGLALILPFPGRRNAAEGEPVTGSAPATKLEDTGDPADADMWTARVRRTAIRLLPPGKLLPDRQPAYVSSWIYVFGVAALAALALAIISGFTIAIGGTDWWHTNSVGHFFNSLHLWSVQLFMAFIVIHLWGKFWMAAWRGKRALTWITGVVAFAAAVLECFTGYLSQQNFDSQWIATNGKDAINTTGLGGFFNLMNFGQMLLWHVVLIPILLVALVGAHVLLVRVRGVSHPLPEKRRGDARPGSRDGRLTVPNGADRPAATTSSRRRRWPR
jgi:Cytochrome b(N-terminal)/b6/petB